MGPEEITALAVAAGTAVVTAAGTDAWTGFKQALGRWFGRGEERREQAELERLDRTATAIETAGAAELDQVRTRQAAAWQTRVEVLLEDLDDAGRAELTAALLELLARHAPAGAAHAGDHGVAAGGDVTIRATTGGVAAGTIHGSVTTGNPQPPDTP